ncbi:putative GATA transcription factor family protein isoform X1 [Iris pallida]|uniref:GATA transcription factor family protein isoform X1 n=1 Tax=Iris pallida TaxID=29817 RepID=A0AAX6FMP9_IRIPA|nr:putative GATA transcription factor family protein isoform X1 [Iris pallida]
MAFNGYADESFDVMCEGLFDNIEDILDFSNGDNVMGMVDSCVADAEPLAPPPPPPPLPAAPSFHSSSGEDGCGPAEEHKICDELSITEDWLSNFLDDTEFDLDMAGAPAIPTADVDSYMIKDEPLFRSPSPVSVLEQSNLSSGGGVESGSGSSGSSSNISSSSTSNSVNNDIDAVSLSPASPPGPAIPPAPARARTKRSRPAAFTPRLHITGPSLPVAAPTPSLDYSSIVIEPCPPPMKKNKNKNNSTSKRPTFAAADADGSPSVAAARKCMHCGIQKTPQWRAGPMGPKTLCNACGVRYKSGRLFPEYRPAASPTFVPSVHSNSHKKVVEMRIKATSKEAANAAAASWKVSPAAKNCDLLLYIRRRE